MWTFPCMLWNKIVARTWPSGYTSTNVAWNIGPFLNLRQPHTTCCNILQNGGSNYTTTVLKTKVYYLGALVRLQTEKQLILLCQPFCSQRLGKSRTSRRCGIIPYAELSPKLKMVNTMTRDGLWFLPLDSLGSQRYVEYFEWDETWH